MRAELQDRLAVVFALSILLGAFLLLRRFGVDSDVGTIIALVTGALGIAVYRIVGKRSVASNAKPLIGEVQFLHSVKKSTG